MDTERIKTKIDPMFVEQLDISGWKLSEITRRYGTLGLYKKAEDSLEKAGLFADKEVRFALELSMALHANDLRTNGHYMDHILRVGIRIIDVFGIHDPAIIKASFLHDAVEDHADDLAELATTPKLDPRETALDYICQQFGYETAELVGWVTNPIFDPEHKLEQYEAHLRHLIISSPKARVIKLSDFIDNAVGNHYTTKEKQAKLDTKYLPMYRLHKYGLLAPDSLIKDPLKTEVLRQLTNGQLRAMARVALQG